MGSRHCSRLRRRPRLLVHRGSACRIVAFTRSRSRCSSDTNVSGSALLEQQGDFEFFSTPAPSAKAWGCLIQVEYTTRHRTRWPSPNHSLRQAFRGHLAIVLEKAVNYYQERVYAKSPEMLNALAFAAAGAASGWDRLRRCRLKGERAPALQRGLPHRNKSRSSRRSRGASRSGLHRRAPANDRGDDAAGWHARDSNSSGIRFRPCRDFRHWAKALGNLANGAALDGAVRCVCCIDRSPTCWRMTDTSPPTARRENSHARLPKTHSLPRPSTVALGDAYA